MIRILELESSKGWGGQEWRTARLARHLDPAEFELYFAVPRDGELYRRRDDIPGHFFPVPLRQTYDLLSLTRLVFLIRKHRINIVCTHSGKDGWLGALAGRITHRPIVRTRHLQTPVKSVASYNLSTRVVCVSNFVRDYLASAGVQREKLLTIHTSIDTERYRPDRPPVLRHELGFGDETILIGIVAVLREAKQHLSLIEAFARLKTDARLLIIGDGPQRGNIEHFISERGLQDRVLLLGFRSDIPEILPGLDIFVLPSRMEALGTAILEASASGVPVVGSRAGGIPECVIHGETGLLFEPGNVQELYEQLARLARDASLRKTLGMTGRDFIQREYSLSRMVDDTSRLYRTLAQDPTP